MTLLFSSHASVNLTETAVKLTEIFSKLTEISVELTDTSIKFSRLVNLRTNDYPESTRRNYSNLKVNLILPRGVPGQVQVEVRTL